MWVHKLISEVVSGNDKVTDTDYGLCMHYLKTFEKNVAVLDSGIATESLWERFGSSLFQTWTILLRRPAFVVMQHRMKRLSWAGKSKRWARG